MADEERTESTWETLAHQLGADVEQATTSRPPSKIAPAPAVPSAPRVALPAAPPKGAPSGWDALLEDFGIATPPPVEQQAAPTAPSGAQPVGEDWERPCSEDAAEASDDIASGQAEQPDEAGLRETEPISDAAAAPPHTEFLSEAADEIEAEIAGAENLQDVDEPPSSIPSALASAEAPTKVPVNEQPQKTRAPSFWESIFGPRPQPEPEISEGVAGETFADPHDAAHARDRAGEQQLADEGFSEPARDKEEEQPARRRSRHRRRGRGRSKPEQPLEPEHDAEVSAELEDEDLGIEDREADESEPEDGESTGSARSKSAGHRTIPTWSEAIGSIVESNLQSRTERRRTVSRSNGGRSRPRGRRKKKT